MMFLRMPFVVFISAGKFKILLLSGKMFDSQGQKWYLAVWLESFSKRKIKPLLFFQIKESKEKERLEKRLLEELFKMFMDSDSFYYSLTYDLTNSVQRQSVCEKTNLPLWRKVSYGLGLVCGCLLVLAIFLLLGDVVFNNVCGPNLTRHILCGYNLQQLKILPYVNPLQCKEIKQKPPAACLELSCYVQTQ